MTASSRKLVRKMEPKTKKTPARKRPRQRSQKSEDTRLRLLEATIDCLAELGLEGTSTAIICEKAGVTRGAYLHHFGSRDALIIEALGHMLDYSVLAWEHRFVEVIHEKRYEELFDTIADLRRADWVFAGFELILKTRTDPIIREAWLEKSARFSAVRRRMFERAFGEVYSNTDLYRLLEGLLDFMRGIKLMSLVRSEEETRQQLDFWRKVFTRELVEILSSMDEDLADTM